MAFSVNKKYFEAHKWLPHCSALIIAKGSTREKANENLKKKVRDFTLKLTKNGTYIKEDILEWANGREYK